MQANKPPRVNWPHHENTVQGFSSRDDFLSSSFLFSLPTQKPTPEAPESMLSLRSSACKIQGPQRLQAPLIEKAWRSLCNTQVARKSYLRPGLSAKVKDCDRRHACTYGEGSYNTNKMATVPGNRIPSLESTSQPIERVSLHNSSHQPVGISSSMRSYQSNHVAQEDMRATNQYNFARTNAAVHQSAPVADNMCTYDKFDAMDDDFLASIDVDRIVMEHYQATPRGSASQNMSTPPENKCNFNGMDEANLPRELSELCSHRCKLAFCREAMTHLQEMKDELLVVANELLDNDGELNPQHSQELL